MTAIRDTAEREGYEVRGLALTSRAAHKLEESDIESGTLQRHLNRVEQVEQKRLYILDEPSLASTKQMHDEDRVILETRDSTNLWKLEDLINNCKRPECKLLDCTRSCGSGIQRSEKLWNTFPGEMFSMP